MIDTEFLFGLNPSDARHAPTMESLKRRDLALPAGALIEFQMVLRSRGRSPAEIEEALLALKRILDENEVGKGPGLDCQVLALQCRLEEECDLGYFDSLIAAQAILHDGAVISSDHDLDRVRGLTRIPLGR